MRLERGDQALIAAISGPAPRIAIIRFSDPLLHHLQSLHLLAQAGNLLLQSDRLGRGDIALFAVSSVERPQVMRNAGLDLLHSPGDLGHRVILVAVVHRLELAAVDRDNGTSEEFEPTA